MKKIVKKIVALILVSILLLMTACSGTTDNSNNKPAENTNSTGSSVAEANLRIGTTGVTGVYYLVGTAFSQTMAKYYPSIKLNVEVTSGSIGNLQMLGSKDLDLGIALANVIVSATKGETESFPKPIELQALSIVNQGVVHIMVAKDSGIKTIDDLKGKKIATGEPGAVAEVSARAILEAKGIDIEKDCTWQRIGFADSMDAISDGRTDAIIYQAGVPVPSIVEAATNTKSVELLSLDDDIADKIISKITFLVKTTIPAGTYGNEEPIATIGSPNVLVCRPDLPEDVAYNMVKTLFDNTADWQASHSSVKELNAETAVEGSPIDFHPGAIKYFKEVGAWKE